MCQKCVDAVKRIFPDMPESDIGELLFSATCCFPCGSPETVEEQLIELKEKTDGTLGGCIAFSERQIWEELEREEACSTT